VHALPVSVRMRSRTHRLQHVIGHDDGARRQLRIELLEHRHVPVFPQVDQREVEGPWKLCERRERIADAKFNEVLELGLHEMTLPPTARAASASQMVE